jgi:hypothetical protein
MQIDSPSAILIGAGLATLGWLYTNRRSRSLARTQHTITALLQASFNQKFQDALGAAAPHLKVRECPVFNDDNEALRQSFRILLNHYEFLAAAIRKGVFDEQLIRDSERGTILALYSACEHYIGDLRFHRSRMAIYEHVEWLALRWTINAPQGLQYCVERLRGKPLKGKRAKVSEIPAADRRPRAVTTDLKAE